MAKTIITHKKPHLDEIAAIWLLQRYHPDCRQFRLKFIAQGSPLALGQKKPKASEILVGTGHGQFDEHTGKMKDSAATLVLKFLDASGWLPRELYKLRAIETVVEHVRMTDFAEDFQYPHIVREFLPEAILSGLKRQLSDAVVVRKGIELIEALYIENRTWEETAQLWPTRVELRAGKFRGAGLVGHPLGSADRMAYDHGFDFVILVDPKYGRRQFRASTRSDVDFTKTYNFLLQRDRDARWYLHHSGKILISGSEVAANQQLSHLDMNELIEIAKETL